jgi:nitrite transporter NirC
MYSEQIDAFVKQVIKKVKVFHQRPLAIGVGGLLAGAYVGFGIILIMTLGSDVPVEFRALVMGATFGVALTLIIFAGAELFTGYTMYTTMALLKRQMTVSNAIKISLFVWLVNLMGAILLALLYKLGNGVLVKETDTVLQLIAYKKMNAPASQLFFNGILCNWLVCLAIWMSARMSSDAAKCIAIFWCLLAFIVSGFEHSVANMTVFSLVLLGPAVEGVTFSGAAFNLLWVTLGNTVGGSLLVGMAYWYMSESFQTNSE